MNITRTSILAVILATLGAFIDTTFSLMLLTMYIGYLTTQVTHAEQKCSESNCKIDILETIIAKQLRRYNKNGKTTVSSTKAQS